MNSLQIYFNRVFPYFFLIVFFILGGLGIRHHDMWRDELQAWMIALHSHSLRELYAYLKYESHPPLWYLLLAGLQKFSSNPISMQWLHLWIASLNAWLILRFAPFAKFQKVLLVFSYFLFYEYSLISRNYSLGVSFIFIFCILVSQKQRNYLLLALILILMGSSHILGFIVSVAFALFLIFEFFEKPTYQKDAAKAAFSLLLFILAAICLYGLMAPASDSGYVKSLIGKFYFQRAFLKLPNVYFPTTKELEKRIYLFKFMAQHYLFFYSFSIAIFISSFLFWKERSVKFLYIIGTLGLFVFFSMVKKGIYTRHLGYIFIFLIACWWISSQVPRWANILLSVILSIHFILGMQAYYISLSRLYSDGKQAAEYIKSQGLETLPMVGVAGAPSTVAGYLDRPMFYSKGSRWGTFTVYDRAQELPLRKLRNVVYQLSQIYKKDVLLVVGRRPLPESLLHLLPLSTIRAFCKGMLPSERIYLYIYKYNPQEKRTFDPTI
jgi:hypothetical protein